MKMRVKLAGLAAVMALPLGGCADTFALIDEMIVGVAEGYAAGGYGGYQASSGGCYTDANGYRSPGCYDYLFAPVNGEPFVPAAQPVSGSGYSSSSSSSSSSSGSSQGESSGSTVGTCVRATATSRCVTPQ